MIQVKENNIANNKIVVKTASAMSNSTKIHAGCILPVAQEDGIPQSEAGAWWETVTWPYVLGCANGFVVCMISGNDPCLATGGIILNGWSHIIKKDWRFLICIQKPLKFAISSMNFFYIPKPSKLRLFTSLQVFIVLCLEISLLKLIIKITQSSNKKISTSLKWHNITLNA